MFDDLDEYDDDFDNSMASKAEDKDFNANELLNFKEYQDRRKATQDGDDDRQPEVAENINIKEVFNGKAA